MCMPCACGELHLWISFWVLRKYIFATERYVFEQVCCIVSSKYNKVCITDGAERKPTIRGIAENLGSSQMHSISRRVGGAFVAIVHKSK